MDITATTITPMEPKIPPTLSRKAQKNPDMGIAGGQESLALVRRARRQERHGRSRRSKKSNAGTRKTMPIKEDTNSSSSSSSANIAAIEEEEAEEEEKGEVENKIMALQKIVPGGESLGVDKLFEETAGYILELQYQVRALKFLASFVEGSDKEKRKLGG